ncbi:MAG TPA: hypothetical protein PK389_02265 [Gammaproteobacteria bacterium]|nr:hypothetical protein [Gammaproteobacteria bacterium]HQZ87694.1 hypothetical protein [Gammaproteobacteria bacterium]
MCLKKDDKAAGEGTGVERESYRQGDLNPIDKLQFAKWVLKGIFVFFVISIAVRLYQEGSGETLMDICRTGLLPIASFVIGDYFGSRG